uniref:Uncharacterized protein n=1 Tax=Anguilla anguilla TaxID=7936 RepID=A0A0E9WCI2_ANGAN
MYSFKVSLNGQCNVELHSHSLFSDYILLYFFFLFFP